jgi:hypothetical protein
MTSAAKGAKAAKISGLYKPLRDQYIAAIGARTTAALTTDTPFVERMVHFWANHFAVSIFKIAVVGLAGAFEFEAIRPHVLGSISIRRNRSGWTALSHSAQRRGGVHGASMKTSPAKFSICMFSVSTYGARLWLRFKE